MASDSLTGNMPTEKMISYFNSEKIKTNLNVLAFESAHNEASKLFQNFLKICIQDLHILQMDVQVSNQQGLWQIHKYY